jgi:hypothetical protein
MTASSGSNPDTDGYNKRILMLVLKQRFKLAVRNFNLRSLANE